MKNKIIYFIGITIGLLITTGCNDYLDKIPDNRTELKDVDAVGELLVSAYAQASYMQFCESMSDNVGDKGNGGKYIAVNEEAYFWEELYSSESQDTPEFYWNNSYEAIATCNQALKAIEELGTPDEALPYKGEALIARAYAHFMLVNLFAKTYDPATANADLGVPFVTEPENVVIKEYKRETVAEIYKRIKDDLEIGLPLIRDQAYEVPTFHFNNIAANAFATRFYLFIGEWDKVVEHANMVLPIHPEKMLRGWNSEYNEYTYYELKARYTHSEESANLLLAGQLSWWGRQFSSARYSLSGDKYNEILLGENVYSGNWSYKVFGNELYHNIPKFEEHFKYNSINATTGKGYLMSPIFSIEEVLLSRAEAYAMRDDYVKAVDDLNSFLSTRVKDYDVDTHMIDLDRINEFYKDKETMLNPFYAVSEDQMQLLKCVIDFKRVEYIHEGLRWFDNRRFHMVVEHNVEDSDTEVLLADDLRKECQIPQLAIEFGLKANPRK